MLNEKPNSGFHWKSKLEEIESLPGETFNKDVAWGKLHERLRGKSGNKRAVWYWVAAACLLLGLIIPVLFSANKYENAVVKNNPALQQIQPSPSPLLQPGNKQTAEVISIPGRKMTRMPSAVKNKVSSLRTHTIEHTVTSLIAHSREEKKETSALEMESNTSVPVTTAMSVVTSLPEKKKLTVVHVNDLGEPETEAPNLVRSYQHRSLQIKFINQELNSNPPSSGNTGFNIFKSQVPPSN